jgi:hypothetical protein
MCGTKMILLSASLFTALSVTGPQNKDERKSAPKPPSAAAGQETFSKVLRFVPWKERERAMGLPLSYLGPPVGFDDPLKNDMRISFQPATLELC